MINLEDALFDKKTEKDDPDFNMVMEALKEAQRIKDSVKEENYKKLSHAINKAIAESNPSAADLWYFGAAFAKSLIDDFQDEGHDPKFGHFIFQILLQKMGRTKTPKKKIKKNDEPSSK